MGAPSRSPRSSSSNVSTKAGRSGKTRPSSPRYATGRRGSLKNSPSKTKTRSKSVESRSPRSPQKVKSKERRPTSGTRKSRSTERDQMPSSSRDVTPRAGGGSATRVQHADRKAKDAAKQVATGSISKDKPDTTPRGGGRRRQSKFPRTSSAGKITKARRRTSQSPSGAKIEEMLISPSGSSTSSRRKKTPPKRTSNLRKRLSVIAEDSRESISTRRRSRSVTRSASRSSSTSATTGETQTDCLVAQDVSLRGSLRENGYALKQLLKKSDAIAPERGGNVYLAHAANLQPPRDVVLKILRRDFAPRTRRQFFLPQEYYICRDLCNTNKKAAHPNIVEFHTPLLLLGSRVCFPMERCSGGDLLQMLYREKKLPETALRGFFSQALDAVQFLHSKEIAHLDLKCEHFLLDGGGSGNVRVRICGFGWATKFDPGRLEEDIYCQTVGYTPPEVVRRHPYDPTKADVFALGATLYILCTGKFPNPRLLELMGKGSPNFPRTPEVSSQLKELVRAMMDADWSRRLELREVKRSAWMKRK